jgi:NADP-dependent 3-hydroxy acid dehydrogenase YdfG
MNLAGKVAVVTGGGTGIGQAVAAALAHAGGQVVIIGRRAEKLQETIAAIITDAPGGPTPVYRALDVADQEAVATAFAEITETYGGIHILVNNAGVNVLKRKVAELSPADWNYIMQVNATGAFNTIHAVLPQMRERKDGVIINVSSLAGVRPNVLGGAAYSASKHAMSALTTVIALEEKDSGIRATNLSPGEVNTPILDARPVKVSDEHKAQILQPEDVAAAVLFIVNLHPRAHVPELLIKPTTQAF